ncbi:MAG TPA: sigma-54 dependent transcriptional regulator [Kofleriaceae bacterium]|nr:sigma-54 dependent transcriptional regulator [Kofleriaceae bacterium]
MQSVGKILVVDDEPDMCELLELGLKKRGMQVTWRTNPEEAFELLLNGEFDCVLTDLNMKGLTGLELTSRIVANRPDVPVVVLTAFGSFEAAVAAMRAGAYDFVTKPVELDALAMSLRRATERRHLKAEVSRLRQVVAQTQRFDEILGASGAMQRVYTMIDQVAQTDATVLITGESGTGKEMVARALHRRSKRADGPFVAINCAAMPEALLESELFGHVKGAFTDARANKQGLFALANGGTLFLDEIGELSLSLQPKLLRVLQERTVRPIGGQQEVPIDVRLLAASNRDFETMVEEKTFREDLYYRINVVALPLPPLRARAADVLLLAQHFVSHYATVFDKQVAALSPAAAERLVQYSWPGNVRELQNCMERAVAVANFATLGVEDLPEKIRQYEAGPLPMHAQGHSGVVTVEEVERRHILHVLDLMGGNRTEAAKALGLDRKTLYRKLLRYGVED